MKDTIIEYLRKGFIGMKVFDKDGTEYVQVSRNKPYGMLIAKKEGDEIKVGYSCLDERMNENGTIDNFNMDTAWEKTFKRIENGEYVTNAPAKIKTQLNRFIKRAFVAFKQDEAFEKEQWDKEKYEAKCYEHLAKILRRKDEKELSKIYEKLLKIKG